VNWLFILFTIAALSYAFFNGLNNSGALIAAPIATRAVEPRLAFTLAVIAEFCGPFLFGTAVASTLGQDLIQRSAITITVLLAGILSAMAWNLVTWLIGLPSSSSNALIGGLMGSALASSGYEVFIQTGLVKVFGSLLVSPAVGLVGGFLFMKLVWFLVQGATPAISRWFNQLNILTTISLAMSHGTNDGQKSMGLITIGLVVLGMQKDFEVPMWVTFACALALALGVGAGGYRVVRTVGGRIYRMRPIHGFASQFTASAVVLSAALIGGPVSTMQVVGTSVMGVGAAERAHNVRWGVASQLVIAWLVTIPVVGSLAGLLYFLFRPIIGP
jgi:PiT family inorganic phosphate transporter